MPTRPHIICHMGTSIDGRLHPSRFTAAARGVDADVLRDHYERIAEGLGADGWIVGRTTMAEMAKGQARTIVNPPPVPREPNLADRRGRTLAVAIDPSGRAHYGRDEVGGGHVVAVLGEQVSDAYLAELREDGVSYVFAGPDGHDLAHAMEQMAGVFGAKLLLLEGGGKINGAFLMAGLIDEFSTLIHPAVDGLRGVDCIIDYEPADGEAPDLRPGEGRALRLSSCEVLEGGMVWLRHAVERALDVEPDAAPDTSES